MKKCPYCAEEIQDEALKCKHCQSWVEAPPPGPSPAPAWSGLGESAKRGFRRSSTDRMLSGVCAGLAHFLGIDPVWVRILYPVATFVSGIVPGLVLYVILALVVPADDALLS